MTHLVVIPTYNSGARLLDTIQAARAVWDPVWVVVDGRQRSAGDPPVNLPAPVRYFRPEEGGVSHFRYRRGSGETPIAGPAN